MTLVTIEFELCCYPCPKLTAKIAKGKIYSSNNYLDRTNHSKVDAIYFRIQLSVVHHDFAIVQA